MPKPQIKLYYRNTLADVIGAGHGITDSQLKSLAQKTAPLISMLNTERKQGKTPYRDLPYNTDISEKIKKTADEFNKRTQFSIE